VIVSLSGLLVAAVLSAAAQQTGSVQPVSNTNQPQLLTIEQALALAEQYNPQLQASRVQIEGSSAAIVTAKAYPNPSANFLLGNQSIRLPSTVPGLLQHYAVAQPVEIPSARSSRIAAARIGRESSEYSLEGVRLGIRAAVKQSFYQVLREKGEHQLAQENLQLVEDLRRRVQVQVDAGEAAKLELTRADAELATARTLVRSTQLQYVTAVSALRAVVSAPLGENIELQGATHAPVPLPALNELRDELLAHHPSISQADAEVRRAREILKNERALRIPEPLLQAEYERQPDLQFYRVGLSLPLPLWQKREGPIAEAVAAIRRAEALARERRLEIRAALDNAYGQYQIANEQVSSLETGALKQAEAAVAAAEAAYRFGERGIIEVLDAQRVLHGVRQDYLNAQFDRQSALIQLEQLRAIDLERKQP
jgi:outer membrane protein, heavy metal efflux system